MTLTACGSAKTFTNTDEVIQALDKHKLTECEAVDNTILLSNDSVGCFIDLLLPDEEMLQSQAIIHTYDDIKQMDLFKDKCKQNDAVVFPDCSEMLEFTFSHSNVMMVVLHSVFTGKGSEGQTLNYDIQPVSDTVRDSILKDLKD